MEQNDALKETRWTHPGKQCDAHAGAGRGGGRRSAKPPGEGMGPPRVTSCIVRVEINTQPCLYVQQKCNTSGLPHAARTKIPPIFKYVKKYQNITYVECVVSTLSFPLLLVLNLVQFLARIRAAPQILIIVRYN